MDNIKEEKLMQEALEVLDDENNVRWIRQNPQKVLDVQILSDLMDFDQSIEDGYYKDNPDEAIKDFKRIMTKVRKRLKLI